MMTTIEKLVADITKDGCIKVSKIVYGPNLNIMVNDMLDGTFEIQIGTEKVEQEILNYKAKGGVMKTVFERVASFAKEWRSFQRGETIYQLHGQHSDRAQELTVKDLEEIVACQSALGDVLGVIGEYLVTPCPSTKERLRCAMKRNEGLVGR